MAFVRKNDPEGIDRVEVSHRDEGFVYFKHISDTSDKLNRLVESAFDERYVDEASLRLEEGG